MKQKKNEAWTDDYTDRHKQLYEKISECMKQNLNHRTQNSRALFDFKSICLGMTINGQAIITDEDAQVFENVINALNDIQTKQITTAIELLQILERAPASTRFLETTYYVFWNNLWTMLAVSAGVSILLGIQSLEPQLLKQSHLVGKYFANADNTIYWIYDAFTDSFKQTNTPGTSIIRCPEGVGFSFFNGLSGNGISFRYTCVAGRFIARMPLNTISAYIWHGLTVPVNSLSDMLSHMLGIPITPGLTVTGLIAAAAITGITFKSAQYLKRKRDQGDVPDVDGELTEVVIEGSEVSKEMDKQTNKQTTRQSKRPRTTRG